MIIDCISDLHGHYPKLEGGDILIVSGDLTASDTHLEYLHFFHWISKTSYKKRIVIAGNHDNLTQSEDLLSIPKGDFDYLFDSETQFGGFKIWGSPWTPWFDGVNPHCKAFMLPDNKLQKKWDKIPTDIDILITHGPPHGILDSNGEENCGSVSLRNTVLDGERFRKKKLHVFGHIHEEGGKQIDLSSGKFVNASIVNKYYFETNTPVRIIL